MEGEEGASALSRGLSGTLLVLLWCLSRASHQSCRGPLPAQSCARRTTITGKDGDDSQRVNPCHSSVWYTLSLLLCVDLVCARSTQKNHIHKKNPKILK